MSRVCIDCGGPTDWALICDEGTLEGYICDGCERKRRRRRMGWRRRVSLKLKRRFGI